MIAPIQVTVLLTVLFLVCFAAGEGPATRIASISTNMTDWEGAKMWKWPIGDDESRRLTIMLGREFRDLNIGGTYVTVPSRPCSKCGKDNEFIDWVYTALERGFHNPEFIYDALRDRRFPKETKHDVYCSGCGYLVTTLRRRKRTPPEVPKVNKKLLRMNKLGDSDSRPVLQEMHIEKDIGEL